MLSPRGREERDIAGKWEEARKTVNDRAKIEIQACPFSTPAQIKSSFQRQSDRVRHCEKRWYLLLTSQAEVQ